MGRRWRMLGALLGVLALLLGVTAPAVASVTSDTETLINKARSQAGLADLTPNARMDAVARDWAEHLAAAGQLSHNPSYSAQIPSGWSSAAENVGFSSRPTVEGLHAQFMDSSPHRANILGDATHIGVGYAVDSAGTGWIVHVFARYSGAVDGDYTAAPAASPAPSPPPARDDEADPPATPKRTPPTSVPSTPTPVPTPTPTASATSAPSTRAPTPSATESTSPATQSPVLSADAADPAGAEAAAPVATIAVLATALAATLGALAWMAVRRRRARDEPAEP
ncbi:CAP domain-containing protein [Microbacterium sp.]|uniref:CAP domain-containing protein n=1 Tax=Microbacterium sp. TaxID=51671 RepID=UPI003A88908E